MSNQANNRIIGSIGSTLTHAADHSISGSGSIGANFIGLDNAGVIEAVGSAGLTLNLRTIDDVTRRNTGTLRATDGSTLTINSGTVENAFGATAGTIEAASGGTVAITSGRIEGGTLTGAGAFDLRGNATLADLTSDADITIANAQTGRLAGTVINDGTISVDSTSGTTSLSIEGNTTLSGTGSVQMSNQTGNRITGSFGSTLTQAADHSISGSGNIGSSVIGLDNAGTIEAVGSEGLTLNLRTTDEVTRRNSGTLRATDGSTLTISSGTVENFLGTTSGTIEAASGGTVAITSGRIEGGTLTGAGAFDLRGNAILADLTTDANITIANSQTGRLAGTVINDGSIALESTGGSTSLIISGDTTLGGSGTLTMSDQATNLVYGTRINTGDPIPTLTHGADHTIRGASGNFGLSGNLTLNNLGTIEADGSAGLNMRLSGETQVNSGTMRALSESTLTLRNTFDNDGGLIEAQDNALVDMVSGTRIVGGTLDTAGTGVMRLSSSATIDGVTNLGRVEVSNWETGRIAGNITNNGEIVIDAGANNTDLLVNGDTTLGGTGTLVMADTIRSRLYAGGSPTLLTNAAGHTIRGGGGIGNIGGNQLGLRNEGLIEADGDTALTISHYDSAPNPSASVNTGTLRSSGAGGMVLTGAQFDNQGLVEALDGSSVTYTSTGITLNNQAGTLTGGTWRAAGDGSVIEIRGPAIVNNNAEIILEGAGSVFRAAEVLSTTNLEGSLTTNQGTLRILDNRDYTTSKDLTNSGLLQLGGGTLDAKSLTNTDTGTLTGYGTVTPRPVNSGLIEATGGTLAMTGGIQGGSGTVTIQTDGALDLSSATQASSADFLNHQGTASGSLNLGSNDFIVSKDYTNANTGTGNAFDARANVVGTGQIVGENADMGITGDVTTAGTNTVTLDLGNVRGGTSTTVDYQIANTGSGADIRGAVQTAAGTGDLTDARLSGTGVTAQNFGPIEAGQNIGDLSVTFNATSGGALDGQTIGVVSNFDNVAGQTIQITGMATSLAEGSATPAGPIDLGNFRVGQAGPGQSFDVENLTTGAGAEKLGIGTAVTTGNFAATNNLGAGLIDGGTSQANALSATVDNGQAGVNTGALEIQYTTDGTHIDAGFTAQNVNSQSIALSATGYNMAEGSATPDPVTLANQRVGGTESQALTVSNTAPSGAYTEGLNAGFGANNGEAVNNAGTIGLLAGGGSNNSSMSVGVDTTAAGARTGSVTLNYETDGTGTSGLAAESVGSQTITVSGNVYQVAEGNLNTTSLNFGVVQVGQSVSQNLSISNIAPGPNGFVEDLNAQFGVASGTGSNLISGSGSISGLVAGSTDISSMVVNVNTASAGTVNGAIAVDYFSAGAVNGVSNGLGILGVGSQDFGVTGTIQTTGTVVDQAAPVINTDQPILLGNVREGAVSPTAFVSVTNQASGNQQAALDATITGNAPITASGSFDDLGPGATDTNSLQVGMNTATAGAIAGTATIGFVSDAGNLGGGQLTLASQDIQVEGAVYRLASPEVDTTQPVVLAARVGDAAPTQNISVTNQSPDAFTEGLKADIGSVDAGFTGSGNIDNLAAEGTDTTSLALGLADTSSSQNISGTVNLDFQSTGAGTTEAADIAVGSEAIQVEGRVYQQAEAQVDTPSVDFGIVHVGDLISAKTVSVTNSALAAALNDTLAGGFLNLPAGPFDGSGSLTGLEVGQSDNSSLAIGLDTSSAGIFDLSGDYLQFASQNPDMDDLDLGTFGLDLFAQVNNYANPWFTLDSSLGTLSVSGYDFVVDFGTLLPDFGTLNTLLSFSNNVTGPADLLRGSYDLTGVGAPFTTSGFGDFNDLGAGDSVSNLSLAFNTSDLGFGIFQESIGLSAVGFNASGFEESFDISLTFRGTIRDTAAVSEPRVLLLLLPGLLALVGLQYRSAARQG
ncbi:hypothetical protein CKO42_25205 [Lamprobacter modestohalophilus]|uniref:Uncharacterized protein n=1 Tax=Lamprobacter modestohalophilus TaxID=1064514 RepID=A0A9X1B7B5_9GAMM|nr:choice-of-anchor D domain-containing protein [Lamprobacter modestohalophilus]MBK1621632.1 hypothetical protein [Lamprobacter modestohalophilus]